MTARRLPDDRGYMGDRRRGASLGRASHGGADDAPLRFSLQRVPLNSGGYDAGGAYWGLGAPLFWAAADDGSAERFFRVERSDVTAAFEARGGVRIGEPGWEEFRKRFPRWSTGQNFREAAKDIVRAEFPEARFYC